MTTWAVHYRDGAGNGATNKSRVFKTERGALAFAARLKAPWNAIRFYDVSAPMPRQET